MYMCIMMPFPYLPQLASQRSTSLQEVVSGYPEFAIQYYTVLSDDEETMGYRCEALGTLFKVYAKDTSYQCYRTTFPF